MGNLVKAGILVAALVLGGALSSGCSIYTMKTMQASSEASGEMAKDGAAKTDCGCDR